MLYKMSTLKKIRIQNFKSIKDLELKCKSINLFIGKPNAGKSNILEALGLVSNLTLLTLFLNLLDIIR